MGTHEPMISITREEFNNLERIKALYEEALEIVKAAALFINVPGDRDPINIKCDRFDMLSDMAREFLEKVK